MFLIRVLELGLIALMISSEIVLSCRWDWILAPGCTGESQGCAVLVLTQQVSHFSIRCLFHMGKLVNLFICQLMPQSEQWAVGWAKEVFLRVTGSTLQEDYVNFLWPQVRKYCCFCWDEYLPSVGTCMNFQLHGLGGGLRQKQTGRLLLLQAINVFR